MIHVSSTDVVSSHSLHRCHLSSDRHHHAAVICHSSFSLNQNEFADSTSSSGNASSRYLVSRAEIEALNPHHHHRPPSSDRPTSTLYSYKKIISILITLPTTQLYLHFVSFLARASRHQSFTHCHRSLSLLGF
jgi:hypothetical protein